jgi:hypothetical protein
MSRFLIIGWNGAGGLNLSTIKGTLDPHPQTDGPSRP